MAEDSKDQGSSNPFASVIDTLDKIVSLVPPNSAGGHFLNALKSIGGQLLDSPYANGNNPFAGAMGATSPGPVEGAYKKTASQVVQDNQPAQASQNITANSPLTPKPVKTQSFKQPDTVLSPEDQLAPSQLQGEQAPQLPQQPPQPGLDIFNTRTQDKAGDRLPQGYNAPQYTPQEKALYGRHITNLEGPGGVDNADGSRSTLFAVTGKPSAKEAEQYRLTPEQANQTYIIPTVRDGKILTTDKAFQVALQEGIHNFPGYPNENIANTRYQQMHQMMEKDTKAYMEAKQPQASPIGANAGGLRGPNSMLYFPNAQDPDQLGAERKSQLQDVEGEINSNNGQLPPDALQPNYGDDYEKRWNNYNPNGGERGAALEPDPAMVHHVTQQVNRAGNMDVMRNVAASPILDQLRQDAIMQLAGDVLPLPIAPGPNQGPASASQIREGYRQGLPRTPTNSEFSTNIRKRLS